MISKTSIVKQRERNQNYLKSKKFIKKKKFKRKNILMRFGRKLNLERMVKEIKRKKLHLKLKYWSLNKSGGIGTPTLTWT